MTIEVSKRRMLRHVVTGAVGVGMALALTTPAQAQERPPSTTRQTVQLEGGRALAYTAEVGRLPIRPMASDEPHAYMGYISYRVAPTDGRPRPVLFMWSGGPSGPSLTSQNFIYGPKMLRDGRVVDNPITLLTDADLVFVDPIGTGFSRPTRDDYGKEFYQTVGDQTSLAEFVRVWRALNDPAKSPIFLYGGSYGTWRVTGVAEALEKDGVRVTGAVLKAGGIQLGADAQSKNARAAWLIPGRTATALHHGRLPANYGRSEAEVTAKSIAWTRDVYIPALDRIDSLSATDRDRIARELARLTGYPADRIDRKTLIVSPQAYAEGLLPGKRLNALDMRIVQPAERPARPTAGTQERSDPAVDYVRTTLGYRTDLAYLPDERGYVSDGAPYRLPGQGWNYNQVAVTPEMMAAMARGEGPPGTLPWLKTAMTIDPALRVLVAAGWYDSLNTCPGNAAMVADQPAGIATRFTLKCYSAGHGLQSEDIAGPLFIADFKAWIRETMAKRAAR